MPTPTNVPVLPGHVPCPDAPDADFNMRRWLQALALVLVATGSLAFVRSVVPDAISTIQSQIPVPPPFVMRDLP